MLNDRQRVLAAKLVGILTQQFQIRLVVVIMLAIGEGNGIQDKMIMQAIGVEVCGDNHLKAVAPHFLRQLHADFVRLFRRDLALAETLKAVIANDVALVLKLTLDDLHFFPRRGRVAVHAGHKELLFRLVVIGRVLHDVAERLPFRFGVFWIVRKTLNKSILAPLNGVSSRRGIDGFAFIQRVPCLVRIGGVSQRTIEPSAHVPYFTDCHCITSPAASGTACLH